MRTKSVIALLCLIIALVSNSLEALAGDWHINVNQHEDSQQQREDELDGTTRRVLGCAFSSDGGLFLMFGEEGDYEVEITATDGEQIFAGVVHSDGVAPVFIAVEGMTEDDQFYTLF